MAQLQFESTLSAAWDLTRKHWLGICLLFISYWIISNLITVLIPGSPSVADQIVMFQHLNDSRWLNDYQTEVAVFAESPLYYVQMLLSIALGVIYEAGMIRLCLRLARGQVQTITLDAVLDAYRLSANTYLTFFLVSVCMAILICIGFLCCILPGFFALAALACVCYLTVDEPELDFIGLFRKSYELTKGNILTILGLLLASAVIVFIGTLCCCIGVLPALVMVNFIQALIYLTLKD